MIRFYDSHPSDARCIEVAVAPTLTRKLHKGGADGILVLIDERNHCEHDSCRDEQGLLEHTSGAGTADLGGRRVSDEVRLPKNGVRRLTPLECERLQGLPDNWTLVDEKSSDTARYKAIGNGMAQPCADFILAVVKRMSES